MSSSILPEFELLSVKAGYDQWAAVYDSDGNPVTALEFPAVREVLGAMQERRVLDAACGTGRHSKWMAAEGASVVGVDFSEPMLSRALSKNSRSNPQFFNHDLSERLPFDESSFDVVLFALAAEHFELTPLRALVSEFCRVLRPGGRLVYSTVHPELIEGGMSPRFFDSQTRRERRVQSHFYPVETHRRVLIDAGLTVEETRERSVDPELAATLPRASKHLGRKLVLVLAGSKHAGK